MVVRGGKPQTGTRTKKTESEKSSFKCIICNFCRHGAKYQNKTRDVCRVPCRADTAAQLLRVRIRSRPSGGINTRSWSPTG